jgi:hypothetical protein
MGWRYFVYTMGGLMILLWGVRFFVFKLHESPKFLMGRGKDEEAVKSVHAIAKYNGVESNLTVQDLYDAASKAGEETGVKEMQTDAKAAARRTLDEFNLDHVKALFATPKLAYSTSIIILLWGMCVSAHIIHPYLIMNFARFDRSRFPVSRNKFDALKNSHFLFAS